ncbi:MAG: radical SAM protein [Candidatus Omnitrophica bacterium]|nr:radical SAM protein [Candidatus Omnitrophota bacterium]
MRILFIDPLGDEESTGLNIGIAYCAVSLIERGHTVSILDMVNLRQHDPFERIEAAVKSLDPHIVGISITNMSFNNSRSCIKDMKRYFKGKILLGGPEITVLGSRSLEMMPEADMAVIGEGERTLPELLSALEGEKDLSSVQGLVWRSLGRITANPPRPFIMDLDSVSFPQYAAFGVDAMDVYPIITSRGCPYGCIFCFSHLGKKWRPRTPENILKEIKTAKEVYRAKMFHVTDASFNVDINRVERFCDLLIENKIDMPWVIQGFRADRVTEKMVKRLHDARCRRIWVGIETLEQDVFKNINKGETIDQIKNSIALMKKYDMEIFGYMLMGLPGDTFKKTLRSFENARKLDLDVLAYSSCVPFTGTAMEKWVKANAVSLEDSYNISSIGTRYDRIAFETNEFSAKERVRARMILNVKSGSYNEPGLHPVIFKIKKWILILRYDLANISKRLKQSIVYRHRYKKSVDNINLKRGIYFSRLPDGTWGAKKGGCERKAQGKRIFLDLKRLVAHEVD